MDMFGSLKGLGKRQIALQVLNFLTIVSSAFMIWKGLGLLTNCESPLVVVLSGSMEPAFYRGDLLFLTMYDGPVKAGEIPVFNLEGRDIPIVHRALKSHIEKSTGEEYILTKGDNNQIDDRGLYNKGQLWIKRKDIMGRVRGYIPYVGMVTIMMNDYPQLKYALLGGVAIMVLFTRE